MSFGSRPHERGLSPARLCDVHVRAMEHELPNGVEVAGAGRDHERRLAVPPRGACIRTCFQQTLHERSVAVGSGERQRRLAVLVDDVHFCARAKQRLGHRSLAEVHSPCKRRCAVGLRRVDVGLGSNQRGERFLIAAFHRFEHAEIPGRRVLRHERNGRERHHHQRESERSGLHTRGGPSPRSGRFACGAPMPRAASRPSSLHFIRRPTVWKESSACCRSR